MFTKCFEKIDMVLVLRIAGTVLAALYLYQAVMNGSHGKEFSDMVKIFIINIANGMFQPLIILGLAEVIANQKKA
jgi:hypothetical protein